MAKHKTTLNLDKELMKLIKLQALEQDITITDLVTLYLKYGIANHIRIKKGVTEKQYQRKIRKISKSE